MVDIIGTEERLLEELDNSCDPVSTPSNKSPTDAALRISLILAVIVATVCVLCLVFAACSMQHNSETSTPQQNKIAVPRGVLNDKDSQ
jgi:hypothetical protein